MDTTYKASDIIHIITPMSQNNRKCIKFDEIKVEDCETKLRIKEELSSICEDIRVDIKPNLKITEVVSLKDEVGITNLKLSDKNDFGNTQNLKSQEVGASSKCYEARKSTRKNITRKRQKQQSSYTCNKCGYEFSLKFSFTHHICQSINKCDRKLIGSHTSMTSSASIKKQKHKSSQNENSNGINKDNKLENVSKIKKIQLSNPASKKAKEEKNTRSKMVTEKITLTAENEENLDVTKYYDKVKRDNIAQNSGYGLYKCDKCNRSYKQNCHLLRHIREIHGTSNQIEISYTCKYCKRKFTSKRTLQRHLMYVQCSVDKSCATVNRNAASSKCICDRCGKIYLCKFKLKAHIVAKHESVQPTTCVSQHTNPKVCKICGETFYYMRLMKKHIREHLGIVGPYKCGHCGRSFQRKDVMQKHVIRKHSIEKPYSCMYCFKTFKMKSYLSYHVTNAHTNQPVSDNRCICGKSFVNEKALTKHKDNLKYECATCEKHFSSGYILKQHRKVVHQGLKVQCAEKCGKCFASKPSMKRHVKSMHKN